MPNITRLADQAHKATLALMAIYLGVLTVYVLNLQWSGLIEHFAWLRWALNCLPILLFLPAIVKRNARSAIWFCFILLVYFMNAVVDCFAQQLRWIAIIEVITVTLLFSCAMMFARWQLQINNNKH